jgi:hypothetical protein
MLKLVADQDPLQPQPGVLPDLGTAIEDETLQWFYEAFDDEEIVSDAAWEDLLRSGK